MSYAIALTRAASVQPNAPLVHLERGGPLALGDKIPDVAEDLLGKAKEAVGKATHNDDLTARGRGDQDKAQIMKDGDDLRDANK